MNSKLDTYHAILTRSDGYLGTTLFPLEATWMIIVNGYALFDIMGSRQLTCSIVGTVASNGLNMDVHGNFIPHGSPSDQETINRFINAAMEFRLTRPPDHLKVYQEDFDQAIRNLHILLEGIADSDKLSNFISYNKDTPELLFSRSIFGAHYGPRLSFTNDAEYLPVAAHIQPYLIPLYGKYKVDPIHVTQLNGTTRSRIASQDLQTVIECSLVEVKFWLSYDPEDDKLHVFLSDVCMLDMLR